MKNIALVGFMGTGKTAVGNLLARRLGLRFVDLDELIVAREKMPITEIFAKKGEPHFRNVEKKVLAETASQEGLVIGCGGGVVLLEENWQTLGKSARIICLTATPDTILKRTESETHRPLLNVPDPRKRIEELLAQRAPFYAKADRTIDTSQLSVEEVVEEILGTLGHAPTDIR